MMTQQSETAALAVDSLADAPKEPNWKERLKDPERWKKSLYDVFVWFLFGGLITTMLSMFAPGYPILVGTNSIPTGLYWLDQQAMGHYTNEYVSFPFRPTQDWLRERYGSDRVFTKMVKAVPGDTIYADAELRLKVCHARPDSGAPECEDIGVPLPKDSEGRPMTPWVQANYQYTLKQHELWVYGPNPKSLDSRYYGPIRSELVKGKATPLILW